MLTPYRVLDLADSRGILCGKILADLGANVIAVEPPWGNQSRRAGPFYQDDPHPEKSLFWALNASNKRSITLDIEKSDGQALLKRLVKDSHFLIESFNPGYLDELGLGYKQLKKINSALIFISITAFGQDGPYKDYRALDLTGMALSGMMYLTGDTDRPPVRVTSPQFWVAGGASGAAGAMIANHHRILTGKGQHVDVSCQQAVARALSHAPMIWDMERYNMKRQGPFRPVGQVNLRINWECNDGYVNFIQPGGHTGGRSMMNLSNWMDEEEMGHRVLRETNWGEIGFGRLGKELLDEMTPPLERFFKTKTKRELADGALKRRILLFPVNDPRDVFEYPQLIARDFFQKVEPPLASDGRKTMPILGPFIKTGLSPNETIKRAPRIGQHNDEVYQRDFGLTPNELKKLKEAKVI